MENETMKCKICGEEFKKGQPTANEGEGWVHLGCYLLDLDAPTLCGYEGDCV